MFFIMAAICSNRVTVLLCRNRNNMASHIFLFKIKRRVFKNIRSMSKAEKAANPSPVFYSRF